MKHMRMKQFLAAILFVLLLAFGLWQASRAPLWNDEFYSLVSSILGKSYGQIVNGGMGQVEGNNSPLFYLSQKLQCDVFAYHAPDVWLQGHWNVTDRFSQVFLRIQPVLYVALAITALFYYFAVHEGLLAGFYALAVGMSSFMLWHYWFQARPYALWFSLTMAQVLLLIDIFKNSNYSGQWRKLAVVHWLLAFTAAISMVQITAAACVLWLFERRKKYTYIWMALLPLAVCLYYYAISPKFAFFFADGPMALVNANIPKDRLLIVLIFALVFVCKGWKQKDWTSRPEGRYLLFLAFMISCFILVLLRLKSTACLPGQGFQISNRYFIALTPVGIIGTVLFSMYLVRTCRSRPIQVLVMGALAALLIFRIQKTIQFLPF